MTTNQPDADLVSRIAVCVHRQFWHDPEVRRWCLAAGCDWEADERPDVAEPTPNEVEEARALADVLAPYIAERETARRADGWDEAHREFCPWVPGFSGCQMHENPYRATQHRSKP